MDKTQINLLLALRDNMQKLVDASDQNAEVMNSIIKIIETMGNRIAELEQEVNNLKQSSIRRVK